MNSKKTIFVAFSMKDVKSRDLLKGQSLHVNSPFEYVDMSVKEAYVSAWKVKVRTRIKRSDGVIVLVSKNSTLSVGQKWEIQCAREEGKKILGLWIYKNDRTNIIGVNTKVWTWPNVEYFVNSL